MNHCRTAPFIKILVFNIFLSLFILPGFAQYSSENETFQIVYNYTENGKGSVAIDDSIELLSIHDGDTIRKKVSNGNFRELLKFSLEIKTTGNNDSSVVNIQNIGRYSASKDKINVPEKLVYKKSKWYSYQKTGISEIPFIETKLIESDQYKTILGYTCKKYLVYEQVNNISFEIWVTNTLPSTLLPGAGFHPFPGAVLEMNFPVRNTRFVATSIKKILAT